MSCSAPAISSLASSFASRSQAGKWTKAVRDRLPGWIAGEVQPILQRALGLAKLVAKLEIAGAEHDKLLLHYPAVKQGTGYVTPVVTLEFGGRATGEPHAVVPVVCDMDGQVDGVTFPTASPLVMSVARTFWEKATATHVYCAQGRIRGERYARHWHDLAAIMRSSHFRAAVEDRAVARAVANHKSHFFSEKDVEGKVIDYFAAVEGGLQIVPDGAARESLAADYAKMLEDQVMIGNALPFDDLMKVCSEIAASANAVPALKRCLLHSHSIVAGGFPEMSYTTRLIPRTSLMMRFDTRPSSSCGRCAQCAVMKSWVCTARSATTYS